MKRALIHHMLTGAVLVAGITLGTSEARADDRKPALRLTEKTVSAVRVDQARRADTRRDTRGEVRGERGHRSERGEVRGKTAKRTRAAVELASRKPRVNRGAPVCVSPHCGISGHGHGQGWKRGHGKVYRPYPVPGNARRDYPRWTRHAEAVYVDRAPFFWHARLGVYVGGVAIHVDVGSRPPAGYLFYDPIRNRTFTCLDTYRAWCARRGVAPVVTLVSVPGCGTYADAGYGYYDGYGHGYPEGVSGGVYVSFGF